MTSRAFRKLSFSTLLEEEERKKAFRESSVHTVYIHMYGVYMYTHTYMHAYGKYTRVYLQCTEATDWRIRFFPFTYLGLVSLILSCRRVISWLPFSLSFSALFFSAIQCECDCCKAPRGLLEKIEFNLVGPFVISLCLFLAKEKGIFNQRFRPNMSYTALSETDTILSFRTQLQYKYTSTICFLWIVRSTLIESYNGSRLEFPTFFNF